MLMRRTCPFLARIALSQVFVLSIPLCTSAQSHNSFDKPLQKRVVDFGPSPYVSGYRIKLTCYFFAEFMVEEFDEGQKGAEWLAILPNDGTHPPTCTQPQPSEQTVYKPDWNGYFRAVKGRFVFFDAADGTDGGMSFGVYDSRTGKRVFKDSTYDTQIFRIKAAPSMFNQLRVKGAPDGQLTLKYLRVVGTECDLHSEALHCWPQVRTQFDIKTTQVPACSGYKGIPTRWPSAIAYPVEVSLLPEPTRKTIAGPVKCWPVD
jgi:hypothetical protein